MHSSIRALISAIITSLLGLVGLLAGAALLYSSRSGTDDVATSIAFAGYASLTLGILFAGLGVLSWHEYARRPDPRRSSMIEL